MTSAHIYRALHDQNPDLLLFELEQTGLPLTLPLRLRLLESRVGPEALALRKLLEGAPPDTPAMLELVGQVLEATAEVDGAPKSPPAEPTRLMEDAALLAGLARWVRHVETAGEFAKVPKTWVDQARAMITRCVRSVLETLQPDGGCLTPDDHDPAERAAATAWVVYLSGDGVPPLTTRQANTAEQFLRSDHSRRSGPLRRLIERALAVLDAGQSTPEGALETDMENGPETASPANPDRGLFDGPIDAPETRPPVARA
ncbi:MAG: hypothetical protein AAF288_01335 [Planctomycetota bacterium]